MKCISLSAAYPSYLAGIAVHKHAQVHTHRVHTHMFLLIIFAFSLNKLPILHPSHLLPAN